MDDPVNSGDRVCVDGQRVASPPMLEHARLWRYHKPSGFAVTHAEESDGWPTVFTSGAVKSLLPRVVSVGRLDVPSEGLLLLSDSSELARFLEHSAVGFERVYACALRCHHTNTTPMLSGEAIDEIAAGLRLADGESLQPAEATLLSCAPSEAFDGAVDGAVLPLNSRLSLRLLQKAQRAAKKARRRGAGMHASPHLETKAAVEVTSETSDALATEACEALHRWHSSADRDTSGRTSCDGRGEHSSERYEWGLPRWAAVRLNEGKRHEVRRLWAHFGLVVTRLVRLRFGPCALGSLPQDSIEEVRGPVLERLREGALAWRGAVLHRGTVTQAGANRRFER